jgi:hypothetical protein
LNHLLEQFEMLNADTASTLVLHHRATQLARGGAVPHPIPLYGIILYTDEGIRGCANKGISQFLISKLVEHPFYEPTSEQMGLLAEHYRRQGFVVDEVAKRSDSGLRDDYLITIPHHNE